MKRLLYFGLLVIFLAIPPLVSSSFAQEKGSSAGLYKGSATGYHGKVNVTVELDDRGEILSLVVDDNYTETKGVETVAIEKMSDSIVKKQSLDIDDITGTTLTGNAILAATASALEKAGVSPASLGYVPVVQKVEEPTEFDPAAMPEKAPVTDSITVTDAKGRKVKIDLPISSYAISTMDVIDYIIPLLGKDAFNMLVASGQSGGDSIKPYSETYTPIVGNYMEHFGQISEHNAPFDLEMILSMDPDVLIVNSAMGAHRHALAIKSHLDDAGIPIVMIDVPGKSITSSVQETITLLGQIFQKEDRAAEITAFFDKQYAILASKNLLEGDDKPTVYYEKSGYSEVFGSTQASTAPGWGSLIAIAGGDNIADILLLGSTAEKGARGTIDPEHVIQSDPEFVILTGTGGGWMSNYPGATAKPPSFDIVNRIGWKNLQAVKNGNVYELSHAMSRSVYSFYACLKLASIFYPDTFNDVDPEARLDEFFDRFMLTDSTITTWSYKYSGAKDQ